MSEEGNGRQSSGRFAKGNPGGPGRPRRAVEREYLAALNAAVSLDDWAKIVAKAVEDATDGDWRSREWVTRYLLGNEPPSLLKLAAAESAGISVEDEIQLCGAKTKTDRMFDELASSL